MATRIRVTKFIDRPAFPNSDVVYEVLSEGINGYNRSFYVKPYELAIDYHDQQIRVYKGRYYETIKCVFKWVPRFLPTIADAEFVVLSQRLSDVRPSRFDRVVFHRTRVTDWYAVFWQVAMLPVCDDVKSVVVSFLIE